MRLPLHTENAFLDALCRDGNVVGATLVFHLSLADPGDDGKSIDLPPAGENYAGVVFGAGVSNWNSASGGEITNDKAITFPTVGANGWGTVSHWAFFDKDPVSHAVTGVNAGGGAGSDSFEVSGDVTADLEAGALLHVRSSTANDGIYTIRAGSSYDSGTDTTTINVEEDIGDGTADGTIDLLGNFLGSDNIRDSGGSAITRDLVANDSVRFEPGQMKITATGTTS